MTKISPVGPPISGSKKKRKKDKVKEWTGPRGEEAMEKSRYKRASRPRQAPPPQVTHSSTSVQAGTTGPAVSRGGIKDRSGGTLPGNQSGRGQQTPPKKEKEKPKGKRRR
jgi:hypothetical protein